MKDEVSLYLAAGGMPFFEALVGRFYDGVESDPDLLALYRRAERAQIEGTNWKAHVQHAREGPGGTLRPEDVIP